VARFARTLAQLLDAGVPIEKGIELSASTLRNSVLREEIERVKDSTVRQGLTFSSGLRRTEHFPVFVSNMAGVGEEGGRLGESMTEVASFYESEVEQQTRLAMSLLEPILILFVGLIVGFIVMAMLLPIFKIGTAL
jgi:type IV pilus assembly protein PilC